MLGPERGKGDIECLLVLLLGAGQVTEIVQCQPEIAATGGDVGVIRTELGKRDVECLLVLLLGAGQVTDLPQQKSEVVSQSRDARASELSDYGDVKSLLEQITSWWQLTCGLKVGSGTI